MADHERLLLEHLHSLSQGRDTVANYEAKFQSLALQLDDVNEHILVATFERGPNPSIFCLVKTKENNLRNLHILIESSLRQLENINTTEQSAWEATTQKHRTANNRYQCELCGVKGHTSCYCKKVDDFIKASKQSGALHEPATMMTSVVFSSKISFLVDSGCTQHMVPTTLGVRNLSECTAIIRVAKKRN